MSRSTSRWNVLLRKAPLGKLLAAALLVFSASLPSAGADGDEAATGIEETTSEIIGGQRAGQLEYPWLARLVHATDGDTVQPACGGAAVSPTHVLTTAHCAKRYQDGHVILGAHDLTKRDGDRVPVCGISTHPDWAEGSQPFKSSLTDNLGIVKLCRKHHHPTISLSTDTEHEGAHAKAWGASWGADTPTDLYPKILQEANFQILDKVTCRRNHGINPAYLHKKHICVDVDIGPLRICGGDAGTPLARRIDGQWTLVGVLSLTSDAEQHEGNASCRSNYGVALRSSHYATWIENVTKFDSSKPAAGIECLGRYATHLGTPGDDTITTGNRGDVIVTFAGNDVIRSEGGNDAICAGKGNDVVRPGEGNDKTDGMEGNDKIIDVRGDDLLIGGDNNDTLEGGAGKDRLLGGNGKDKLVGDGDNDFLNGGKGKDTCIGGPGKDKAKACEKKKSL